MKLIIVLLTASSILMTSGCSDPSKKRPATPTELTPKIKRFVPVVLSADQSRLSSGDQKALQKLTEAALIMDRLYLRQGWAGNEDLLKKLEQDPSPEGAARLQYFQINMGPWSRLDRNEAFLAGAPSLKPPYANFYPEDMTREEFTTWLASLPLEQQKQATGFFTVIRRESDRRLKMVPYNVEYEDLLVPAARLLQEAADLTDNQRLKTYLTKRADAFLSNDYYDSDLAWMDLDSPIEPTIGPYEVYMDELFNYKAAFEAFIALRNDAETAKLTKFSEHLQEIENSLPIEDRYKNPKLGSMAPIRVVDQVAIGGEARAGVQTAAFNLPNDERVTAEKGSKRVMLRNVQQAKFEKILKPVAAFAIDPAQQPLISFEPFFTHILAHELMHGLGPHSITLKGKPTTVRQAMKELSSALEEAKADIAGLFALQRLVDTGVLPKEAEQKMYVTFLAGVFRSVRFGITEAHGQGMALQFNYLAEHKAFEYNETTGTYRVNFDTIKDAVRNLTGEIMTIQAEGDYERARLLLLKYATVGIPLQRTLDKMSSVPVDIRPVSEQEMP
jgi:hypothetical protein